VHPSTRSAFPQAEQESIFRTLLLGGLDLEVYLVVLDRPFRATTKKVRQLFFEKKSVSPQKKNPGYAYIHRNRLFLLRC